MKYFLTNYVMHEIFQIYGGPQNQLYTFLEPGNDYLYLQHSKVAVY